VFEQRRPCNPTITRLVEAFDAVVKAVEDGRLTEQRIDESVRRVLKLKKQMGR
jgi:beta-N-acetylhexosaminidase